jgi:hypothetical protein
MLRAISIWNVASGVPMATLVRQLDGDPKHTTWDTTWVRNYIEVNGKQYIIA